MTRLTNPEFADRTGCDYTSASRIRNGKRMPSLKLFAAMCLEFRLDANEAVRAIVDGRDYFTEYLNAKVFDPPDDAPEEAPSTAA